VTAKTALVAGLLAALTAGCGEKDVILPGERFDIRATEPFVNQSGPVNFAAARVNADWSHRNGGPDHLISDPALGANLSLVFATDIGAGDSRRARITAEPVVAGNVIYTLDAAANVVATSTSGAVLWTKTLAPHRANRTAASGGGVSVSGGKVFATSGFGELTALDAASGATLWTQDLDAPGTSSPTVKGDLVYVVARNSAAWALDVNNGRIQWQLAASPTVANFGGGAGVAATDDIAVFPFPSGEVIATFPQGGLQRWSAMISGDRPGKASAAINDISGDPVIIGDRVYVGNFGGQVAALNLFDGERIWTSPNGALGPVWPAGNAVFLVSDLNQLVRLDAATGDTIWKVQLPIGDISTKRQQTAIPAHYGPILAGGRLIVTSSDGNMRSFDPASGALIGAVPIPSGAASSPVVAGGTLYVISKEGQLLAFR